MKGFTKGKVVKLSVSILFVMNLFIVAGLSSVFAADDLIFNDYNSALVDGDVAWLDGDAGGNVSLDDNALKVEYGSEGWFGTAGGIDTSEYKFIKVTIKGATGGEGADFNMNYAHLDGVGETEKAFAELTTASGNAAITTDYQDVYIDMAANGIEGLQGFHFNFHEGVNGTIWIDEISFTTSAPVSGGEEATDDTEENTEETTDENEGNGTETTDEEANPQTSDMTNTGMYLLLVIGSVLTLLFLVFIGRRSSKA